MPDREKVVKSIDICLQRYHCGEDCPYCNVGCMEQLREDALVLLKAQKPGWISVKDRLPEKSGTYLCYQPKAADICALNTVRWSTQLGWIGKEVGSRIEWIEYWMPLPEPPKEEEHATD